jgi:hypothetical protein
MSSIPKYLDPKYIEKQNKKFHKLSRRKQRLAIAEDVLTQIKAKKYVANKEAYVILGKTFWKKSKSERQDLQKHLLSEDSGCRVCGLGAAFCSMSRLGDIVTLDDGNKRAIHGSLQRMFVDYQLALIECAFEGVQTRPISCPLSKKDESLAWRFFDKYGGDHDKRLAAIFRNIIKNDGTFKP